MIDEGRLRMRSAADTDGKNREILGALERRGENLPVLRLLANSPTGLRPVVMLANALMQRATLPASDREVVVLRLAAHVENDYEWREHEPLSAAAGVTDEQRLAIRGGGDLPAHLFSESQLLAISIADALAERRRIPDDHWKAACTLWGVEGTLDLVLSTAFWGGFVPIMTVGLGLA